jgi:hypothetical protein
MADQPIGGDIRTPTAWQLVDLLELTSLDQLDQFRSHGAGSAEDMKSRMHAFSEILTAPPSVEILRVDETTPC